MKIEDNPEVRDLTPRADMSRVKVVYLPPWRMSERAHRQIEAHERREAMVITTAHRYLFR